MSGIRSHVDATRIARLQAIAAGATTAGACCTRWAARFAITAMGWVGGDVDAGLAAASLARRVGIGRHRKVGRVGREALDPILQATLLQWTKLGQANRHVHAAGRSPSDLLEQQRVIRHPRLDAGPILTAGRSHVDQASFDAIALEVEAGHGLRGVVAAGGGAGRLEDCLADRRNVGAASRPARRGRGRRRFATRARDHAQRHHAETNDELKALEEAKARRLVAHLHPPL